MNKEEMKKNINSILRGNKIPSYVDKIIEAPQLYRFVIKARDNSFVKVSKYKTLEKDFMAYLQNENISVIISNGVYIDIPKKDLEEITLPKIKYEKFKMNIKFGKDINNNEIDFDLKKTPHILISGETGSGKSNALNIIVEQLLKQKNKVCIIDTKKVGFNKFDNMVKNIDNDAEEALMTAEILYDLMNFRYETLKELNKQNIYSLSNEEMKENDLCPLVLVVDELADIFYDSIFGDSFERYIEKIAIKGRGAGIHLILGTQRADSKIFSPVIKANMSLQIAFKTSTASNSRVAIGEGGAEKLNGSGDFLVREGANLKRGQAYKEKENE